MSGTNPARRNARLTLFAQLLNIIAGSGFAAAIVAPLAVAFYTGGAIPLSRLAVAGGVWLAIAGAVHGIAQWILGGVR